MNTAWVLLFIMWPGMNSSVSFQIENLQSAAECARVAKVIDEWRSSIYGSTYKCIEVIRK